MSKYQFRLQDLKAFAQEIDLNIKSNDEKAARHCAFITDYIRIFKKFATSIGNLSQDINSHLLNDSSQEGLSTTLQFFSNSLLRIKNIISKIILKTKNQVYEPLKTFKENYEGVNKNIKESIAKRMVMLSEVEADYIKFRNSYYMHSQKFQRNKSQQTKLIMQLENGNQDLLNKFNKQLRQLTQNISEAENCYQTSLERLNSQWEEASISMQGIADSYEHNEQSRISFSQKTLFNTIKLMEDFNNCYDREYQQKIDKQLQYLERSKAENAFHKLFKSKMEALFKNCPQQRFVSYQETLRIKRKKNTAESSQLQEIFALVDSKDKETISKMISLWFEKDAKKSIEQQEEKEFDECKNKVLVSHPYSIYFVELIHHQINESTSYYCKLKDQHFFYLLNAFVVITKLLQEGKDRNNYTEWIYKMMQISTRVQWLKNNPCKSQPIELLTVQYGKAIEVVKTEEFLDCLLNFLMAKKRALKKSVEDGQQKGMIGLAKGFYASVTGKKEAAMALTSDERFCCLEELVSLVAHFSFPNRLLLPFLKDALKGTQGGDLDYLKSIIFNKKDIQIRQQIFLRTQIKKKKEEYYRKALQEKKMAQACLLMAAKRGYFSKQDLGLRLVCKATQGIHQLILSRLDLPISEKWIRLIPSKKGMDYISMKQEVAETSVPSAIEEIISLDVNRSLHNHGELLNPTVLRSLLRTYAFYHPKISYCQGMNYIAGYLYIKTREEMSAYQLFQYLMQKRFKELFLNEFQILKIKMYQFERLLQIFHPEISEHFKRQNIVPECYIVSWIITLFASSYQTTMESYIIDCLWERFIIWGWRQFHRFALWIFSLYKTELRELAYDKALHFLGELTRSPRFLLGKQEYLLTFKDEQSPYEGMQKFYVTQDLLLKINEEKKYE